ncbi:autotransporter domain-containing protein [Fusobacterium ulcerans]|uniref:autotransporter domain-containing protein n=1 Tax=Fusobacterium ulcerans TaxID=861 RepID=UPI002E7A6E90|nr:autotransporter domain-containing protein [Fusobacterium ulcerans]MEE0137075.1 autotransporter domain-containing protein [Fusobacterium ulcerans]
MISNFSEVEKSLKRCLKEKVSITAATVVGFLIAGTVAFGGDTKAVEFTTTADGQVTVKVDETTAPITGTDKSVSVADYEKLTDTVEETKGALAGLLTVTTDSEGVTTFAGIKATEAADGLGKVTAKATENGELTLIKTDDTYKNISSSLEIEAEGYDDGHTATAMLAANTGDTVTNAAEGKITAGKFGVGMKANADATAENAGTITVTDADGVGMLASGDKATATNAGTIEVNNEGSVGMSATTKADETATLTNLGTIDVQDGTGIVVDGAGTVNIVGTKEATATSEDEGKPKTGTIEVTAGKTGISVAGEGTTTITGGAIKVEDDESSKGIDITGKGTTTVTGGSIEITDKGTGIKIANTETGTTTVTGTAITLKGAGTGINAEGNVKLEDIAITLTGAGTGIAYTGGENKAIAKIDTGDMDLTTSGATGIKATMSKAVDSELNITTGSITTGHADAVGIAITGADTATTPKGAEKATAATVTTTLGNTLGTGVAVTGKANNNITVTLQDIPKETTAAIDDPNPDTILKGIDVADNSAGIINIDVKQSNLQVAASGSLVNVGAIKGTTNVNINENVKLTDNSGNIVKAAALGENGVLNINLNVKDENDSAKTLNVEKGKTALDLSKITTNGTASVKNTGSVTIEGTGTLVNGNTTADKISLTNQGLITLSAVKETDATNNSHISKGAAVNVANYGTITLSISSAEFIAKAGDTAAKKSLDQLTIKEVQTALGKLGVIADESTGEFSSVGFIKLTDGLFTTAQALDGEQTVENLAATLNHQSEDKRAFAVADKGNATIVAAPENNMLKDVQLSLAGTLTIAKTTLEDGTIIPVTINNADVDNDNQILIEEAGQLAIADGAALNYSGKITATNAGDKAAITIADGGIFTLSNGELNMVEPKAKSVETRVGIKLAKDGDINLINSAINADIVGGLDSNTLKGKITSTGDSAINNKVTDIATIAVENGMLTFGANSKIALSANATGKTTINLADGKMKVELGEDGSNVLKNTENKDIEFTGTYGDTHSTLDKGKVVLATSNLTEDTTFTLGNHEGLDTGDITADGDMYYTIVQNPEGNREWTAKFNNDLLLNVNNGQYAELNNIYAATQSIHDLLSDNLDVRATELDNIYSNNIYSETVKMSLDTLKMNEDAVLSLNVRPKQGEFTAQGKFLFNNTDYDREGVTRDYKVETKNNGLLGALEYGLTDTSSVGFAFSGTKQDLDMKNGASADGDAFYFGLYRNDTFNNIDLTTGLGYMIDRVDAENFIGKDKFDSTALSGYIQGKYNYAIGENLTLSPKARLTVTRFQQDSINNGRMKQEEIKDTMADVELGVELKKGIALETGKMNLLAGASFTTNVAGKDDDYYKVNFISKAGNNGASTKVKGANLEKNSLKLNVGADVELTNGVFYNGGLSYEFDNEDRDSIGVTLGAGYKF